MTKSAKLKIGVAAVLTVLMVVVILQNSASVTTRFLLVKAEMPQIVLLFIALVAGFIVGVIAAEVWAGKRKR